MMSRFFWFAICFCIALFACQRANAKEYLIRCDLLEVEFAAGDDQGIGEPASTKFRHVEVKVDEASTFSTTRVEEGWSMTAAGKVAGIKDGKLMVKGMSFAYGPEDGTSGNSSFSAELQIPGIPTYCSGGLRSGGMEPPRELFVFFSMRVPAKSERENDEQCAEIRKTILAEVAKRRKERAAELGANEKAAASLLELAKKQLGEPENEAAGRVLLQWIVKQATGTKARQEAMNIWNGLPDVKFKFKDF
jgi:hypothetical protein